MVQKIYSKMCLVSCTTFHRDVTHLVNHRMVKNTKIWISWERNIIFLRNKKILNLCLRWHILRMEAIFKILRSFAKKLLHDLLVSTKPAWLVSIKPAYVSINSWVRAWIFKTPIQFQRTNNFFIANKRLFYIKLI